MKTFKELKENLLIEKSMKVDGAKVDIKKVGKEFKVDIDVSIWTIIVQKKKR